MSQLLLDTHVFLWWLADSSKLNRDARSAISGADLVYVSAATIWEIAIKARLGKVDTSTKHLDREIQANGFSELAISVQHGQAAGNLPLHHDDPFDRMLIAQGQLEGLTIITHDKAFAAYRVPLIWT